MKNSAEYWNTEYTQGSPHFRALSSEEPSISAITFVRYLEERQIPLRGNLLEVGCGMGRNSNWLSQKGFDAIGVDFSKVAIQQAQSRAEGLGLVARYQVLDIADRWPFADESMDYVLDFVTSHLLTREQLESYKEQLARVLKKDGLFVIYTLDRTNDKEAQKLLQEHPGPEPNTYVIPEMGHQERTFNLEEITTEFPFFKVQYSDLVHRPTRFGDKIYDRYYWWVVFKK